MKKIIFVFFQLITLAIIAQTPANDRNWQFIPAKSDPFDSTAVNTHKWHILNCASPYNNYAWGGASGFNPKNTTESSSGHLLLRAVDTVNSCGGCPAGNTCYNTGGIQSIDSNYSFGYFEIKAWLPGFRKSGKPCATKFWPAFWAYTQWTTGSGPTYCITKDNEIDDIDGNGGGPDTLYGPSYLGVNICTHWHMDSSCVLSEPNGPVYDSSSGLFEKFHTYSFEWDTARLIFYFDSVPYYETFNNPKLPFRPLYVVIDNQLDGLATFDPSTPFPQYMKVNYFNYYQLINDSCSYAKTFYNITQVDNFTWGIRSSITFSPSSSITLNSDSSYFYREVNSFEITNASGGVFSAPAGCKLGLIPNPCR